MRAAVAAAALVREVCYLIGDVLRAEIFWFLTRAVSSVS